MNITFGYLSPKTALKKQFIVLKGIEMISEKNPKSKSKIAGSKRRKRRFLFLLLCVIAILVSGSILVSFVLTGIINSFFKGVLGEWAGARIEAPIVEELLKPLSLVILAAVLSRANRKRSVRINWLRSIKVDYAIGYASGLAFGVLESGITYGTFSGLRAITPFLHALGTGIVGIGIYYMLARGKRGIVKLIPLYFLAVFLHAAWNAIGSQAVLTVFGLSTILIGIAAFPLILAKHKSRGT